MFEVQHLSFSYGSQQVLEDISFRIAPGRLCGLFGPNGSGKSTLFRCCLRLLNFRQGRVVVNGQDTRSLSIGRLARLVAYVPQEHKPPFPYTAFEVVLMGRTPHMGSGIFGISQRDRQKSLEALERLGITDLAERPYDRLSGGQRQLVLIARAIAQETPVILLDEPTASLDFNNQIKTWNLLRQIARQGITILACSHDPNHVAWFCDQLVVIGNRHVVADGPPRQALNAATLDTIYRGLCQVETVNGLQVVLPRNIESQASAAVQP